MSCYNFVSSLLNRYKKVQTPSSNTQSAMPVSDDETILTLKKLLHDKTEEVKLRDQTITMLERELDDKDVLIRHLQNEIDKFRQVVRPLTQKIITKQIKLEDEALQDDLYPEEVEDEEDKVYPRMKRQAISAEPLNSSGAAEMKIVKVPKVTR